MTQSASDRICTSVHLCQVLIGISCDICKYIIAPSENYIREHNLDTNVVKRFCIKHAMKE